MNFSSMTVGSIVGGLIFSSIGLFAFGYGKRTMNMNLMGLGGALMGYTFVVSGTAMIYIVGAALTVACFYCRD